MIERLLHLRPGDFRRGLPLFSYNFLIIASTQIGQVARDALVLDRFSALQLPYLDISVAILIGFVVALYIRLGRMTSLRNLPAWESLLLCGDCRHSLGGDPLLPGVLDTSGPVRLGRTSSAHWLRLRYGYWRTFSGRHVKPSGCLECWEAEEFSAAFLRGLSPQG